MTKKIVVQRGNFYEIQDKTNLVIHDQLPIGTYVVRFNEPSSSFFLEGLDDFVLPEKIYGKSTNNADRIINTFADRPFTTGVLLSGMKGAGKTLLAKQVSVRAREMGYPTILINNEWHGDVFNTFIQNIESPAVIIFDEFEKVYRHDGQQAILTLLDGVFPTKKLFLVTANLSYHVSEYMLNRPGRIYYNFKFDYLDQDFIREFCEDRLHDQSKIESVLKYTSVFSIFNFDMLAACVEEMNRYNESLTEVLEYLNIEPSTADDETHEITATIDGKDFVLDTSWYGFNPNNFEYVLFGDKYNEIQGDDDEDCVVDKEFRKDPQVVAILNEMTKDTGFIQFTSQNICGYDRFARCFTFQLESHGHTIKLKVAQNFSTPAFRYDPNAF